MSPKAIFAQAAPAYWIDVAARLRDEYGWEICYFIGKGKQKQKALKLFPNAIFHTYAEAKKTLTPDECRTIVPSPLDKRSLSALSFHESIFMKMMDRYNFGGSLTHAKRISTYHTQLMYWKAVLEHFRPDVVVYRIAPHMGYDYLLYALCRMMDIPTVMFERTSLPGFVYPVESFEKGSEIIRKVYTEALKNDNPKEVSLTPETIAHLESLSQSYKRAMPFHLKFKMNHFKKGGEVSGYAMILLQVALEFGREFILKRRGRDYLLKKYHKNLGRLKRKRLLAHYNQLANKVNLQDPYIFVALQCEPERQTCPVGGVFGNQYLMVDLLSKLIPKGWKIYVKEHVSQFKEYQAAERSKDFEFYDMIASKPNVELVPLTYTSFELIDNAKASATISGTVGWESVVRGKATLLFGHSWYRDFNGVFVTHTVEACQKAIQKIQTEYQVKRDEVKCFAHVIERCSTRGYIDKLYGKMNIVSPEKNVENLAKTIHEFVS
jgi:hypothetical protein